MNQLIFDRLCELCDQGIYAKLTDDNCYYAAQFVAEHFDLTDVYSQVDKLLQEYLSK